MTNMGEKNTVLVVDDAPANLQVVRSILKDDFKIKVATSGAKALELVKTKPYPDLILLDVMMPEMDGYEVCGILKSTPEARDIPVIFLTGKTDTDDETKGFEVGAVDYIHKPFSPAVVKARVHTHLVLRESRDQLARQLLDINNELEMAREIQLSILPHEIPKITGMEIAARYIPMSSVAGDFYDFIQIDDKHIGILIADVSGHGLPSALIASMLQVALSGQAGHATEPAKVLLGLNRALCGKFTQNFVTATYVYVDLENNQMRYAGAGHPPMLQWRNSTGKTAQILENGLFLGMFGEASYEALEFSLEPGDRYVLYTDGILEATNSAQEQFGADRLMSFIKNHNHLEAEPFSQTLLDDLAGWSNQTVDQGQQDDITLLLARRQEAHSSA